MPAEGEIARLVAELLGAEPDSVERLRGGANNVVARVVVGGRAVVAKAYFAHPRDPRDRVGTEFDTLSFLWRNGVRCVPEPVAVSRDDRVGVYGFVEGVPLAADEVSAADAAQLADLLGRMWELRTDPEARQLPAASEAFFTLAAYLEGIERRLERLRAALDTATGAAAARAFVEEEVVPRVGLVRQFVEACGSDLDRELPGAERTLSPADFGFHNALRRGDGTLVFLDFEYAGWDDPATVLSQGCLAPEVPMPSSQRDAFVRDLLGRFGNPAALADRFRLVYPLVALKWSMVVLNDFLPVESERRAFAGTDRFRRPAQLAKSRRLLAEVDAACAGETGLAAELSGST